jgi:hypothetical protein
MKSEIRNNLQAEVQKSDADDHLKALGFEDLALFGTSDFESLNRTRARIKSASNTKGK